MREGVLGITVAEWTRDIALVLSGVVGFLHWGWWYPVVFGAIAALVREASQGFVKPRAVSGLSPIYTTRAVRGRFSFAP